MSGNLNWKSTKFVHAMFIQGVATIALFTKHLTGAEWITATSIALTVYAIADVAQKRVVAQVSTNET
jgi:hypothetical protein